VHGENGARLRFSRAEFKGFAWRPTWGGKTTPEGFPRQGRGVVMCWK
jgi:hypothetical protein